MKKIIIFVFLIAMMFMFAACGEDDDNKTATEQPTEQTANEQTIQDEPTTKTTELTVWGMTCGRCENKIKNALLEIDGIIDVFADSSVDKVTVEHEPDLDVTIIEKTITGEGFNLP
jgi:copper chaperone CopZ